MRLFALIGTLLVLLLPFAIIHIGTGPDAYVAVNDGLLWYSVDSSFFSTSNTHSFQTSWIQDNGIYESYFGNGMAIVGLLILILLVVNIGLAITSTERERKSIPAIILLVCGVLLLVLRIMNEAKFYDKTEFLGVSFVTWEIPLGFILALIFSMLDLRSSK